MRGANQVLVSTFAADASVNQYQAVVQGASDYHATNPAGAGVGKFVGFTLDSADSGDSVPVVMLGTAWCTAAGAINAGDYVVIANAQGQVESGQGNVVGIALSTTTQAGDYVLVYIAPTPGANDLAKVSGTTDATAETQEAYAHGLGYTPTTVLVTPKGNGVVYESQAADATNIYLSASAASINFDAYVG